MPLIGHLHASDGITAPRLREIVRRFFNTAADTIDADHASLARKLRRAPPHWMRHTHATHALADGATLTTVRDNLRHASITTTSIYQDHDEVSVHGRSSASPCDDHRHDLTQTVAIVVNASSVLLI